MESLTATASGSSNGVLNGGTRRDRLRRSGPAERDGEGDRSVPVRELNLAGSLEKGVGKKTSLTNTRARDRPVSRMQPSRLKAALLVSEASSFAYAKK